MRSQVRGGDNDKLCFSVVSDRKREMEKRETWTEKQDRDFCGCFKANNIFECCFSMC